MGETRQIELGTLTLRDDGILHARFDFDTVPTEDAATEYAQARRDLTRGQRVPVIVEMTNVPYVDQTIRRFFFTKVDSPPCRAVVTTQKAHEVVFKTFQMDEPASVPTRVFTRVEQAVEWILESFPPADGYHCMR